MYCTDVLYVGAGVLYVLDWSVVKGNQNILVEAMKHDHVVEAVGHEHINVP